MEINGKEYLSPQEQLYENTKDIEKLKQIVKPVYQTTATLTSSSVSVAVSDTNIGTATEGWLMTNDGLLFKITANDGTTVLLIYYADLKGPQGEDGAAVNIDDSTTSATKVWSSNKVNTEVEIAKDKGIYFTKTQPTYDSGTGYYILDEGHFTNLVSNIPIKTFDLVLYIDSNNKVKDMYYAVSKTGSNWSLNKEAEFGGGKQLYQHNIFITTNPDNTPKYTISVQIYNDDPTQFTESTFHAWLVSNGYERLNKYTEPAVKNNGYPCVAFVNVSSTSWSLFNTILNDTFTDNDYALVGISTGGSMQVYTAVRSIITSVVDKVIPL